jgi:hypothetical protein
MNSCNKININFSSIKNISTARENLFLLGTDVAHNITAPNEFALAVRLDEDRRALITIVAA